VTPKNTNAAIPAGKHGDHGVDENTEVMPRTKASFKAPSLGFLSPEARDALAADVRAIARDEAGLPSHVSQRTVERWTSLPSRDYLAAAREAAFPSSKIKRLVVAKTVDVVAWIESKHRPLASSSIESDEDAALDEALASVGARRVR
jgi:hypothetical protein